MKGAFSIASSQMYVFTFDAVNGFSIHQIDATSGPDSGSYISGKSISGIINECPTPTMITSTRVAMAYVDMTGITGSLSFVNLLDIDLSTSPFTLAVYQYLFT